MSSYKLNHGRIRIKAKERRKIKTCPGAQRYQMRENQTIDRIMESIGWDII